MKTMSRFQHLFAVGLTFLGLSYQPILAEPALTIEKIMGHPSWIGQWPEDVKFVPDSQSLMYVRRKDSRGLEVVEIDRQGRNLGVFNTAKLPEQASYRNGKSAFIWQGDLFISSPRRLRLTQTVDIESWPRWIADDRLLYHGKAGMTLYDIKNGSLRQVAQFVGDDNKSDKSKTFVQQQQDRLFPILQDREQQRDAQTSANGIPKLYIGSGQTAHNTEISPDLRKALVVHSKTETLKTDKMPNYVTRDGYIEQKSLRAKVGDGSKAHHSITLFDLADGSGQELSYDGLPNWSKERPLKVEYAQWSSTGRLALMLFSQDFKDRWLVEADLPSARLKLIEHLHDPAWHAWDLNEFGWTPDGKSLWYQSEKTGYAHIYLWDGATSKPLTQGQFLATHIKPSPDGRYFYFRANRARATQYDIFRVDRDAKLEQITQLGGNTGYDLSPDGREIAFLHSSIDHPPEIYLQKAAPKAIAQRITNSTTEEFKNIDWTLPSVVAVPSSHHERPIASKLYLPKEGAKPDGPAVIFVHGAGYLQNSDEAWSVYFREFMFHTLLTRLGVTVLDMDYRASAGYGRDWRAAIYRHMGSPELEDLKDGATYLIEQQQVDPERIAIYGGSYGGFMTLMAMFKAPDLFACGAALRPVTDWAQYNHGYTGRILNTPEEDPEAYLRSSPIEFAEGLKNPLLICHGLIDDNVVAQDTIRLSQRLIQLEKENWEVALYPLEPHGFIEPTSWLDQYRRILKLFRQHLRLGEV